MFFDPTIINLPTTTTNDHNLSRQQRRLSVSEERAVANARKAVENAAVVNIDTWDLEGTTPANAATTTTTEAVETGSSGRPPVSGSTTEGEEATSNNPWRKLSWWRWLWIAFQFVYSVYFVCAGRYFSCDGIPTLRIFSVTWGFTILVFHVLAPMNGWKGDWSVFVAFCILYIWSGSAAFENWGYWNQDEHEKVCSPVLYWSVTLSVIAGIGSTGIFLATWQWKYLHLPTM